MIAPQMFDELCRLGGSSTLAYRYQASKVTTVRVARSPSPTA